MSLILEITLFLPVLLDEVEHAHGKSSPKKIGQQHFRKHPLDMQIEYVTGNQETSFCF